MLSSHKVCSLCSKNALGKPSKIHFGIFSLLSRSKATFNDSNHEVKKNDRRNQHENKKPSYINRQKTIMSYVMNDENKQRNKFHKKETTQMGGYEQQFLDECNQQNQLFRRSQKIQNDDREVHRTNDKVKHIEDKKEKPKKTDQDKAEEKFSDDEESLIKLKTPDWDEIDLIEIHKKFYKQSEKTSGRCDKTVNDFRISNEITVEQNAPKPILSFDELSCSQNLIDELISQQNLVECTPIQSQGIPIALSGKNMIGISLLGLVA